MENKIILEDCPACRGTGMLMHEGGWNVQVECADCGAHTVYLEYETEEEKREAELDLVAEMLRREQNRIAGARTYSMEEMQAMTEEVLRED